ncbi:MAG: orotate phosphoribosyltransferase, partial [Firmicutes bacterium]|nr:orotate phosphoribosyltransferase [Bacillota bacterium]
NTVAGPAMGGVILAYEVARALGARAIFAEKVEKPEGAEPAMAFKRGFVLRPGERVLVVEDAVTTGGSIRQVMDAVQAAGGQVVAVGAVVDRSAGTVDFGVPFKALLTLDVPSYLSGDCPQCRAGILLVRPKAGGGT